MFNPDSVIAKLIFSTFNEDTDCQLTSAKSPFIILPSPIFDFSNYAVFGSQSLSQSQTIVAFVLLAIANAELKARP